jgi:hypothetical protein
VIARIIIALVIISGRGGVLAILAVRLCLAWRHDRRVLTAWENTDVRSQAQDTICAHLFAAHVPQSLSRAVHQEINGPEQSGGGHQISCRAVQQLDRVSDR